MLVVARFRRQFAFAARDKERREELESALLFSTTRRAAARRKTRSGRGRVRKSASDARTIKLMMQFGAIQFIDFDAARECCAPTSGRKSASFASFRTPDGSELKAGRKQAAEALRQL